jgi:hypothetical protein
MVSEVLPDLVSRPTLDGAGGLPEGGIHVIDCASVYFRWLAKGEVTRCDSAWPTMCLRHRSTLAWILG